MIAHTHTHTHDRTRGKSGGTDLEGDGAVHLPEEFALAGLGVEDEALEELVHEEVPRQAAPLSGRPPGVAPVKRHHQRRLRHQAIIRLVLFLCALGTTLINIYIGLIYVEK
jgi:hypothetical protein